MSLQFVAVSLVSQLRYSKKFNELKVAVSFLMSVIFPKARYLHSLSLPDKFFQVAYDFLLGINTD